MCDNCNHSIENTTPHYGAWMQNVLPYGSSFRRLVIAAHLRRRLLARLRGRTYVLPPSALALVSLNLHHSDKPPRHPDGLKHNAPYGSMDPEHASIAGRLFFSQAENNQKAKRRKLRSFHGPKRTKRPRGAEKSFTARTAALRLSGRTRCAQTLPLRNAAALQPPRLLFSGRPAIRTKLKEIREVRDFNNGSVNFKVNVL